MLIRNIMCSYACRWNASVSGNFTSFSFSAPFTWLYIDDYLLTGSPKWFAEHWQDFVRYLNICNVTINLTNSILTLCKSLTFCGIELDFERFCISLNQPKLTQFIKLDEVNVFQSAGKSDELSTLNHGIFKSDAL